MIGPEMNSECCFRRISRDEVEENIRTKIHCPPTNHSFSDLLYSNRDKTKAYFKKRADIPAETSGHFQLHTLITCNSAKHFASNSELLYM